MVDEEIPTENQEEPVDQPDQPDQPDQREPDDFRFLSNQISTQQNIDPEYEDIGVVHLTESAAINLARGLITGITNVFGVKGFDNVVYDRLRNEGLQGLQSKLEPDQKVCNLRMEFSTPSPELLFVHLYGTLLKKR
jgi:hypothetical protein